MGPEIQHGTRQVHNEGNRENLLRYGEEMTKKKGIKWKRKVTKSADQGREGRTRSKYDNDLCKIGQQRPTPKKKDVLEKKRIMIGYNACINICAISC
jgi:hypothetical protein